MDQFIINIAKQGDLGIALYTLITIVIASILSGIIGFEREFHGHAAGLRTHILVAIGASIIMTVSIYGFRYTDYSNRDPARLAAQVVSGIGFLGAGTIMQTGTNIKGLTTAATVWFCGGIGLACGCGFVVEAIIATLSAFVILVILRFIEKKTSKRFPKIILVVDGETPILKEALAQAKLGRMQILDHMMTTISEVRPELSKYAPKVKMIRINPDKIRDVIGSGGKVIQEIIEKCNDVKIDIEQDGRVFVMHSEMEWINKAIEIIENLTREPVVGQIYPVKVVKIVDFGAFVELWPGCEGLVHISELDLKRVAKVEDVVHVGDEIVIKLLKIDDKGKLVLSRKAVLKQNVKPSSEEEKPENTEEKHDTESNTEDSTK